MVIDCIRRESRKYSHKIAENGMEE